jgi:hypothetical protein
MNARLSLMLCWLLACAGGCKSTQVTRDDVGRIPERLVAGLMTVKSAETDFVEQKQALLAAVDSRQSRQITPVEKHVAHTLAALNALGKDPNWVPAQRELLMKIIGAYQGYFSEYGQLARLWIIEQPGRTSDSGLADRAKKLVDDEAQLRADLKKLADMMAWELTRKIDTVNSLILTHP